MDKNRRIHAHITVLVLLTVLDVTFGQTLVDSECVEDVCFSLYRKPGVTWINAYEECLSLNQSLVTAPTVAYQQAITRLYDPQQTQGKVWMSAQRSNSQGWTRLDGQAYNGLTSTEPADAICAEMKFDGSAVTISATTCSSAFKLIACERLSTQGDCGSRGVYISGYCVEIPVNFTNSWTRGQMGCGVSSGTLAYRWIDTQDFTSLVNTILSTDFSDPYPPIWVGIQRKPWVWISGPQRSDETPLGHYQWTLREGESVQGECMYTELSDNSRLWADMSCTGIASHYICTNGQITSTDTTDSPTTRAASGSTGDKGGLSTVNIIIIACVGGGVLLILIIIIAVVVAKRRARNKKAESQSEARYDYPVDTYHSYMTRVDKEHPQDRELKPYELDPYKSAESVRQREEQRKSQAANAQITDPNSPKYNDVFMVYEM